MKVRGSGAHGVADIFATLFPCNSFPCNQTTVVTVFPATKQPSSEGAIGLDTMCSAGLHAKCGNEG